jgi:hypothetical protein
VLRSFSELISLTLANRYGDGAAAARWRRPARRRPGEGGSGEGDRRSGRPAELRPAREHSIIIEIRSGALKS